MCTSSYISRVGESVRMRWTATWHLWGEKRNANSGSVGKLEEKRPFGCSGCRWEGSKMVHNEVTVWYFVKCAILAQERYQWRAVVDTVANFLVS